MPFGAAKPAAGSQVGPSFMTNTSVAMDTATSWYLYLKVPYTYVPYLRYY